MKNLSLIQRFSLTSLIAMILVGLAFGLLITDIIKKDMFRHSVHEAKLIIYENVIKHFTPSDLQTPKIGPDYDEFSERIHHLSLGPDIHKIKVWNKDMVVVWFNDRTLVGKQFLNNEELKRAFAGEENGNIKSISETKKAYKYDTDLEQILELYVPVRFNPDGPIDIVLEVYQDINPIHASMLQSGRTIWLWTFSGFAFVFTMLFGIVWNASRHLNAQTNEIEQSRQDWEDTFNTITDMITVHDNNYNIIRANKAAEKLLKLPESFINKEVKCFKHYHGTEKPPEGCPSCACYKSGMPAIFELYEPHLKKDIEIRALPRFDSNKQIKGLIHVARDISQRKHWEKQLETSRRELRNLTAHLLSVREDERQHVAREIHDELAQTLTTLNMELLYLDKKLPKSSTSLHAITDSMAKVIDSSIETVKKISSDLRPKLLDDLGLQAAIKWHIKKLSEKGGTECNISLDFIENHIHRNHAITVFRIFQEAVTNVIRHANASKIEVFLKEYAGSLLIRVNDNGMGITKEQISSSGSLGLIGLRERVRLCKGNIKISGAPDKGTSISVSIPLDVEMENQQHVSNILT
jgi:signal transduction histidine kinase